MTARGGWSPDRVARGLPTGGQGSKVYVLCAEPKEYKHFRPGTRPGGFEYPAGRIGDRGDREIVYVPNVYVPSPAPSKALAMKQLVSSKTKGRRTRGPSQKLVRKCDLSFVAIQELLFTHCPSDSVGVVVAPPLFFWVRWGAWRGGVLESEIPPSTARNSMSGSERSSLEPLLKKEASPAVWGGENSGNALEPSNSLNYRVWGIPSVLSRGIPGKALSVFPGSFRHFLRKVPAVLGVWPIEGGLPADPP